MRKSLLSPFILALLICASVNSFAQFSLSGQFRPRTEFRNGFKKPAIDGDDPALFTEQRTRLTAGYKSEKFDTKLSIQDIRIWGETGQINKSDQLLSVHEAYADYLASKKITLRIGRQEIIYDDHRVFGSLGWAAQARSHDAVRFMLKDSTSDFHLGLTWNQDGNTPEPAKLIGNSFTTGGGGNANTIFQLPNPKTSQFAWYKKTFGKSNITALLLNDGTQTSDSTVHWRQTIGVNPTIVGGNFKLFASFYYQIGQSNDSTDLNGLLASVQATYTGSKKFIPTIGFDFLSGDDKSTADKIEGFNPLYGTHHKFYGLMDYFYVGNGHNGGGNNASGGLLDIYFKGVIKTGGKAKFLAHLHGFMSPTTVYETGTTEEAGSFLGTELDLVYVQPLTKGVMLKAGYSQLFGTDSMNYVKGQNPDDGSGFNSWAWVMIDFKPKFL